MSRILSLCSPSFGNLTESLPSVVSNFAGTDFGWKRVGLASEEELERIVCADLTLLSILSGGSDYLPAMVTSANLDGVLWKYLEIVEKSVVEGLPVGEWAVLEAVQYPSVSNPGNVHYQFYQNLTLQHCVEAAVSGQFEGGRIDAAGNALDDPIDESMDIVLGFKSVNEKKAFATGIGSISSKIAAATLESDLSPDIVEDYCRGLLWTVETMENSGKSYSDGHQCGFTRLKLEHGELINPLQFLHWWKFLIDQNSLSKLYGPDASPRKQKFAKLFKESTANVQRIVSPLTAGVLAIPFDKLSEVFPWEVSEYCTNVLLKKRFTEFDQNIQVDNFDKGAAIERVFADEPISPVSRKQSDMSPLARAKKARGLNVGSAKHESQLSPEKIEHVLARMLRHIEFNDPFNPEQDEGIKNVRKADFKEKFVELDDAEKLELVETWNVQRSPKRSSMKSWNRIDHFADVKFIDENPLIADLRETEQFELKKLDGIRKELRNLVKGRENKLAAAGGNFDEAAWATKVQQFYEQKGIVQQAALAFKNHIASPQFIHEDEATVDRLPRLLPLRDGMAKIKDTNSIDIFDTDTQLLKSVKYYSFDADSGYGTLNFGADDTVEKSEEENRVQNLVQEFLKMDKLVRFSNRTQ